MPNNKIKKYFDLGITLASLVMVFALPKITHAATLFLSPSSGSFGVGSTITVNVRTNTQNQPVNTAEANITYSTNTLELVRVSQGSTFYLPSPGSPQQGNGTVYLGGGLPNPGYNGSSGTLGTLTFRAKAQGTASITITSGKVLLNDGSGTNALQSTAGAQFTINPPPVGAVTVTSATHASGEKWYTGKTLEVAWDRPSGVYGYSFELNQEAETIPDDTLDTTVTQTKSYPDLSDGTWYFHIKARGQNAASGFGPTVHFAVHIDTEVPKLFEISLVGENNPSSTSRTPTIRFEAEDAPAGIDHYEVLVDDKPVSANAVSPYTLASLDNGPHVIRVVAFDKAGNIRKAELPVIVAGAPVVGFFDKNLTLPIYLLFLMNLLIIILMGIIIWLLLHRRPSRKSYAKDEVGQLQYEIDETLEKLRHQIDHKLLALTSQSSQELFEKESKVAKAVASDITKTRKKIDTRISRSKKLK